MKELFIQNSIQSGSLKGGRLVYLAAEAPQHEPEKVQQQSVSPEKNFSKEATKEGANNDVKEAKVQERTFMEKAKLKMGLTTEARLDLENSFEKSPTQETANRLTADVMKKANEAYANAVPGSSGKEIFSNLSKEYGINFDGGALPANFARRALDGVIPDSMLRNSVTLAKGEKLPTKPTEEMQLAKAEKLSDLQNILDNSQSPEKTLNAIAKTLKGKVDQITAKAGDNKPEEAFADFAKKFNIDKPVVWASEVIVPRVLRGLQSTEPNVLQSAIADASKIPSTLPTGTGTRYAGIARGGR